MLTVRSATGMYRVVAGIDTKANAPGLQGDRYQTDCRWPPDGSFRRSIKPITERSRSSWKISGSKLKLDVEIPANTKATIYVPGRSRTVDVGSGVYSFASNYFLNRLYYHIITLQGYILNYNLLGVIGLSMIAVLTGDIVSSRKIGDKRKWLTRLREIIDRKTGAWQGEPPKWSVFRGDGFQVGDRFAGTRIANRR